MLYVFEMANNHQGKVEHAKKIIKEFSQLAKNKKIKAAIKLQFRQLDTFIHDSYKESDLKFVKRFNETRLSESQFKEIIEYIEHCGLITMATPFDNESISWLSKFNIAVVKVASCSIDDWPLLNDISKINKKIIISTAGADMETLKKVYNLFKSNERDFAFMHCVGEYPTPVDLTNLSRINLLKKHFPDIEIGFSTHESPNAKSMSPYAVSMGCTILEKHVGVETEDIKLNKYSNTVDDMSKLIDEISLLLSAFNNTSEKQHVTLKSLKRGVYLRKSIEKGTILKESDIYFALPVQDNQLDASNYYDIIGKKVLAHIQKDHPLIDTLIEDNETFEKLDCIREYCKKIFKKANIDIASKDALEVSCHYGINNFKKYGAIIVDKINREFCKKLIVMMPGQKHPTHHHIRKEEAFELLYGDCKLVLNGKNIYLEKGKPILISRGVKHSFSSKNGCVIEEISTTHYKGDSIYEDYQINSLKISDRKIIINQ